MTGWLRPAFVTLAALGGALAVAAPVAQARVGVVFGFGFGPTYWGPPVWYYPPPVYYYPPPAYYPPPPTNQWYTPPAAAPIGQSCNAGAYVCPMQTPVAPGTTCWCPNNQGGRTYGKAT